MSLMLGGALVKRSLEANGYVKDFDVKVDVPGWVMGLVVITLIAFAYQMVMINYTFAQVIPTLIMVESPPEDIAFQVVPTEDNDMIKDPETVVARSHYLTSTFRSSMKLLRAQGGYRGRFRGISMYIVQGMASEWIASTLSLATRGALPRFVCMPVAAVLCAQLSLGWTLTVITESSPLPWYRRVPSMKTWKKIAGPTAIFSLVQQITTLAPWYLLITTGITQTPKDVANLPLNEQQSMYLKSSGIWLLAIILDVALLLPARAIFTRMQASLISDSEDTIVPFDRTFGGKVVPEIVGGSGMIGALDAWKTFEKSGRVRLVKAYFKAFAMLFAVSFFFLAVLAAEVAFLAPDLTKAFEKAHGN